MGNLLDGVDDDEEEEIILESSSSPASASIDFPLHRAAALGDLAQLRELASASDGSFGVAIDEKDTEGNTPLHVAAMHGKTEAAEWLLDRGRSVFLINGKGETPSAVAKQSGFEILAQRLENREKEASRKEETRKFEQQREALYAEMDRKSSTIAQLRASERRLRLELDNGAKERLRLLLGAPGTDGEAEGQDLMKESLAESLVNEYERSTTLKATRDALAAELALCELAFFDLEQALHLEPSNPKDSLSVRIKLATRHIAATSNNRKVQGKNEG